MEKLKEREGERERLLVKEREGVRERKRWSKRKKYTINILTSNLT